MDQLSELKAMMTKFGNTIAMLEQTQGLKPQVRSMQPNSDEKTSNFSPLPRSSQCDGVDKEQKTYSIAENNLSSESGQSQNSSELLTELRSTSDGNNSETYFSSPSTSLSLPNEDATSNQANLPLPKWIVKVHNEDQFKNVFFDCSNFDIKLFLASSPFLKWYTDNLETSSWKDFNSNINGLADVCVKQIETYFSTKQKPKQTRLMHSTERHHLSATVAVHFPKLASKYADFQLQYKQGTLNCSRTKTSPNRSHFMEFFFCKVSSRMDYSYKAKNDQDREEVPLRKPLVSQSMKQSHKDHPRQAKKMKFGEQEL